MMRILASMLVVLCVVMGCATTKIESLRQGMTKAEVEQIMGRPQGYAFTGPTEVYRYTGLLMHDGTSDYSLFFLDGKLMEWTPTYKHRPTAGVFVIPPIPRY